MPRDRFDPCPSFAPWQRSSDQFVDPEAGWNPHREDDGSMFHPGPPKDPPVEKQRDESPAKKAPEITK